jgi:hypothetical protein
MTQNRTLAVSGILHSTLVLLAALSVSSLSAQQRRAETAGRERSYPFLFSDVGDETGLFPDVAGIQGHAAGWGDVDGDGLIDLYVGTFHKEGGKANMFFRNDGQGKFRLDDQPQLRLSSRASGALFADLDNDGDLDLYVSSMPQPQKGLAGCTLFRNDGQGKFTDFSKDNSACPTAFGGRSATVLDFDGDGLLDLLVGEDPLPRYNGSPTKSTRLFRNRGKLQFEDASQDAGLTAGTPGLGVAAGDLNNDGWPDFFLASSGGGNVLFLNDGSGRFREAPGSREFFAWKGSGGDNMICGVSLADLNRDGLLDIVIGQHFETPWKQPVPTRLYLHRGLKDGNPIFEDVTAASGMTPLPLKGPHVEIQDFDNDGWPDIYVSLVKFAGEKLCPLIFKHLGIRDGIPRFREDVLALNDFPTAEDLAIKRTGDFFDKVVRDKKIIYMAPGPSGDFDNDGRLDLFLASWWPESRSLLLHNETPGGNWLQVQLQCEHGNRMGIGAKLKIYPAGKLGDASALLGCRDMAAGYGYASAQPAIAHFGLGDLKSVDLEVILPHGKGTVTRKDVKANQKLTLNP